MTTSKEAPKAKGFEKLNPRMQARVLHLLKYMEGLIAKMKANPNHPKVPAWQNRYLECERSVQTIAEHGVEVLSSNPVGVEIKVPTRPFGAKPSEPEVKAEGG